MGRQRSWLGRGGAGGPRGTSWTGPDYPGLFGVNLGVVGRWTAVDGEGADFEVREFIPSRASEDPVTGSLNAGLAQWLIGGGLASNTYPGHRAGPPRPGAY